MHIQDPTSVAILRSPDATSSRLAFSVSVEPAARARGQVGVRNSLSMRVDCELLNWIPISSSLHEVPFDSFVRVTCSRLRRRLFVVFVYALTDCSLPEAKGELYWELSQLLCIVHPTNVVIALDELNA